MPIRVAFRDRDEGFTLIELLVVIIIIGILAAIAIPVFLRQRQRAVEASMRQDLRTVAQGMETYYADNQSYPADLTALATGLNQTITLSRGNTLSVVAAGAAPGTYCLKAVNPSASTNVYYDSDTGGLLLHGVACS